MNAETENQHLKELLKRLQDENSSLRTTAFTFSVPRNGGPSDGSFDASFATSPSSIFVPTSHLPSPSSSGPTKAATPQSSSLDTPSSFPGDIDFGSLSPLDPSTMNILDDSDAIMSYDFGYGQFVPSKTPYKTIASNPMFMSFADPNVPDNPTPKSLAQSPGSNAAGPYELTFGQWTGQTSSHEGSSHAGSLDELFGGHIFASQSPVNFSVLMKSPVTSPITTAASAMSPIAHQSIPGPSTGHSPNAGPGFDSSNASSPATHSASSSECPKTRAQLEQHIHMIMCKGATFPMTEKSDNNIEVLTAWRSITSHPDFKASVSTSPFLSLAHATHSNSKEYRHQRTLFRVYR